MKNDDIFYFIVENPILRGFSPILRGMLDHMGTSIYLYHWSYRAWYCACVNVRGIRFLDLGYRKQLLSAPPIMLTCLPELFLDERLMYEGFIP